MSADLPYKPELLARFTETVAQYRREHGQGIDAARLATGLLNNGIGLIDTARRAFLVDLDVYQGSQQRLRDLEARLAEKEVQLAHAGLYGITLRMMRDRDVRNGSLPEWYRTVIDEALTMGEPRTEVQEQQANTEPTAAPDCAPPSSN